MPRYDLHAGDIVLIVCEKGLLNGVIVDAEYDLKDTQDPNIKETYIVCRIYIDPKAVK